MTVSVELGYVVNAPNSTSIIACSSIEAVIVALLVSISATLTKPSSFGGVISGTSNVLMMNHGLMTGPFPAMSIENALTE